MESKIQDRNNCQKGYQPASRTSTQGPADSGTPPSGSMCFVVNRKITRDEALKKFFFDEALPAWRKTFDEHVREGIIKDAPEMFPEFKKAYRSITSC